MMLSFTRLLSTTLASVIISTSASRAAKILRDYQDYDVADSHVNSQTLIISDMVLSPDGFERPATVAGGGHPGQLITAWKGDLMRINVTNNLSDPTLFRGTSIHWHGMNQHTTTWADGVVGVSQCPISPGESFMYQFDTTNQAGTFWYHSHYRTQYCDGLRGPMIIYDRNDPSAHLYDVDDENTIITLSDWYHLQSPSITGIAQNDATLINGQGRRPGGPLVDLAVINVVPGKRYRFRIIAMSCDPDYIFSIDGHKLTIIEADGSNTQPLEVDGIHILAGQRYSAVLTADQPVGNYWMRALPNSGNYDLSDGFVDGTNSAILRYAGASIEDPTTVSLANPNMLDETLLHPLEAVEVPGLPFPGGADVNINLALDFSIPAWRFYVNGVSFDPPSVPVLLQILSGQQLAQNLLPQGTVYSIPRNSSVEISIPGGVISSPHPFHLHGHAFSVVKSAGNDTAYNYVNPVIRDVVSTGDVGSNTTIRFRTDNAGPWILHCHIDWHFDLGLAVVLAEDIEDISMLNPRPTEWDNLCPAFNNQPMEATSIQIVPTPAIY